MGATMTNPARCTTPRPDSMVPHQTRPDAAYRLFEGESDLITVSRLHEITGLDKRVIRDQINEGTLPGCKIGNRYFVPKCSLIEYVTTRGGM